MLSFRNWKVGARLALVFVLLGAIAGGIAALGGREIVAMRSQIDAVPAVLAVRVSLTEWQSQTQLNAARAAIILQSDDVALDSKLAPAMKETTARISVIQKQIDAMELSEAEKQLFEKVGDARKSYIAQRADLLKLKRAGDPGVAAAFEASFLPALKAYEGAMQAFVDGYAQTQQSAHAQTQARSARAIGVLAVISGIFMLFAAWMAYLLARSITKPLNEAVEVTRKVAAGDLTSEVVVRSRDETGMLMQELKDMTTALMRIVSNVRSGTDAIDLAAKEIAQGNANLSQRTEEQASSLEETASSMEELTTTVRQNAENAKRANQLSAGASEVAVKGGHVVGQVVSTMNGISESSKKIADIIGVIDGIAFQTNILALNAAVEAARAGEQGRGFAVVASEVRNLAQKSAAAAKEIKSLIGDSVDKVGAGAKLVESAGKTMEEIVTSVKRVTDIMAEIAAASQQQSAGIEQVNTAITQMDGVTQQNASLVEEAAAAAESMEEQARTLIQAVAVFKLGQEAQGYASGAAAPVAMKHAAGVAPRAKRAAAPQKRVGAQAAATLESANESHLPKPKLVANAKVGSATAEWTEH